MIALKDADKEYQIQVGLVKMLHKYVVKLTTEEVLTHCVILLRLVLIQIFLRVCVCVV